MADPAPAMHKNTTLSKRVLFVRFAAETGSTIAPGYEQGVAFDGYYVQDVNPNLVGIFRGPSKSRCTPSAR